MNFQQNFSQKLKASRKEKGLSQKQLAELLGYSEKTVSKWESGNALPTLEVFSSICNVLGLDSRTMLAMSTESYHLGIDGGGTKTSFCLCDSQDRVVSTYLCEGCNPYDIGIEQTKAILKKGLIAVCGDIPYSSIRVFAGIAGGRLKQHSDAVSALLQSFGFAAFDVGNDNDNLISVALGDEDGITVIMGTGFCIYRVQGGVKTQIAGFGYLFDEGGSAFNLGQDALSAIFAAFDGDGEQTMLSKLILDKAGMSERELLPKLYEGGKRYIASFSPLVFEAAKAGDKVAQQIVRRNMVAVAKRIEFAGLPFPDTPVKVVVAGGMTKEPQLLTYLKAEMSHPERFQITILEEEILSGAVRLAKKL